MKYYLHLFKLRLITNMQYRANAIAGITTQIFFGLVYVMVYIAFYKYGNSSNVGMNLNEMVTYLWLQQATLAINFSFRKDPELVKIIKDGNICYEIIKPQNFFIKRLIKSIANSYMSTLLRFAPVILFAFLIPAPYRMSAPASISSFIIFLIGILLAGLLNCTLITIVHILVMFTVDSRGLFAIYGTIADFFMGGLIPLTMLPVGLQKIAYHLPFRYIQDFPLRVYSGNISVSEGISLLGGSIIWIIILIIVGLLINKLALKKAVVNGG